MLTHRGKDRVRRWSSASQGEASEVIKTTNTLILDLWPPELKASKLLLLKPPNLWYFVQAVSTWIQTLLQHRLNLMEIISYSINVWVCFTCVDMFVHADRCVWCECLCTNVKSLHKYILNRSRVEGSARQEKQSPRVWWEAVGLMVLTSFCKFKEATEYFSETTSSLFFNCAFSWQLFS